MRLCMAPLTGAGALDERVLCSVSLNVRPIGSPSVENRRIAHIEADARGVRDEVWAEEQGGSTVRPISEPIVRTLHVGRSLVAERLISLEPAFPRWAWLDGEAIERSAETEASLMRVYEEVWSALKARDASRILPRFVLRTRELATAFNRSTREMERLLDLESASQDPSLELWPLDPEAELEIFGDGKLARMTRWDGEPLVVFVKRDRDLSQYYDIVCCRLAGKWIIIR